MSYYVCSDIHGRFDRYQKLLDQIQLTSDDRLFILGDVIDRNPDGILILQDAISRSNVELFLGNHEWFLYQTISAVGTEFVTDEYMQRIWCSPNNGGAVTAAAFCRLEDQEKRKILTAIEESTLLRVLEIDGIRYHLSHSFTLADRQADFYRFKDVSSKEAENVVWKSVFRKVEYHARYSAFDPTLRYIVGHVPVQRFSGDSCIYTYRHITDVDCGSAYSFLDGNSLACLRLDDQKEYYIR